MTVFIGPQVLAVHGRTRRVDGAKNEMCDIPGCHRRFFHRTDMYRHQRLKHGAKHRKFHSPSGNTTDWSDAHIDTPWISESDVDTVHTWQEQDT